MNRRRYVPTNPVQVRARQVTAENLWDVFDWIPAGKPHYRGTEDGVVPDGLTLWTDRGRPVAYFGDWVVRTGESGWAVLKDAEFRARYAQLPAGEVERHCCSRVYFCPASDETECPEHSGFDRCCDNPDRHRPVAVTGA